MKPFITLIIFFLFYLLTPPMFAVVNKTYSNESLGNIKKAFAEKEAEL